MKSTNGITLIALVITVIIILILSGIALNSVIGNGAIIENANYSVGVYNNSAKYTDEQLKKYKSQIENYMGNNEKKILDEKGYLTENYEYKSTANPNLKITIPKFFALMNEDGSSLITTIEDYSNILTDNNLLKKGIVVQAKDGSQFVWIPVTNTTATGTNNMYWEKDGKKVGQLYTADSGNNFKGKRTEYSTTGGISEPSVIANDETSVNTITQGNKEALLVRFQSEFEQMINSVIKYGGFYVGRYETSINEGKIKSVETTSVNQIITAANDGNASGVQSWYGLYTATRKYSEDAMVSSSVNSCMIWGSAYDQIMLWMQNSGIDIKDTSKNQGNFGDNYINTGSDSKYKINNIYDLSGNYQEATMACMWSNRQGRGGAKGSSTSLSSLSSAEARGSGVQGDMTTRIQLYINE